MLVEFGVPSPVEVEVAVAPPGAPVATRRHLRHRRFNERIVVFSPSGAYLGQKSLGYDCGVATDPAGNLYVAEQNAGGSVHKLTPTGPAGHEGRRPLRGRPVPLPAGRRRRLRLVAKLSGAVPKIASEGGEEGETEYTVDNSETAAGPIAIDPISGHLFVTNPIATPRQRPIREFDVSGASPVLVSSTSRPAQSRASPLNGASGNIYVSREARQHRNLQTRRQPPVEPAPDPQVESGEGTVVSNPAGIECVGATGKSCEPNSKKAKWSP